MVAGSSLTTSIKGAAASRFRRHAAIAPRTSARVGALPLDCLRITAARCTRQHARYHGRIYGAHCCPLRPTNQQEWLPMHADPHRRLCSQPRDKSGRRTLSILPMSHTSQGKESREGASSVTSLQVIGCGTAVPLHRAHNAVVEQNIPSSGQVRANFGGVQQLVFPHAPVNNRYASSALV